MKQILSFVLASLMLVSLVSCQSAVPIQTEPTTETQTETATTPAKTENAKYPTVPEPLTWDRINAIPIATNDMTGEELRKICDDMMRLSLGFQWTPNQTIQYRLDSHNKDMKFAKGAIYAGNPYSTPDAGSGNIYSWMEYSDPATGILDVSTIKSDGARRFLTNHCSSACFWAWSRVVNSMTHVSTTTTTGEGWSNSHMVKKYGFIPVAPFTYPENLDAWTAEYDTGDARDANGEQTMYQAYANVKLADGFQTWLQGAQGSEGNHVQIVAAESIVSKNADKTINGKESYVFIHEQTSTLQKVEREDGVVVMSDGRIERKVSFESMYKEGYVPFTFAEFHKQNPVEKGAASLDYTAESATPAQLKKAKVSANYAISSVSIQVMSESGEEIYRYYDHPDYTNTVEYTLEKLIMTTIKKFAKENKYNITISVRISTGEELVVYRGSLVSE